MPDTIVKNPPETKNDCSSMATAIVGNPHRPANLSGPLAASECDSPAKKRNNHETDFKYPPTAEMDDCFLTSSSTADGSRTDSRSTIVDAWWRPSTFDVIR